MEIREATADDAAGVRRVAAASWHAAHDHIVGEDTVDDLLDRWYAIEDLPDSIEREEAPMFVAVADGGIVGFAQGGPSDAEYADAVIGRIYVHPDRWGEGHGTALLERLFEALRTAGHESVWLAVMADNEVGRSFYDARGFEVREERTEELEGAEFEEAVMVRSL